MSAGTVGQVELLMTGWHLEDNSLKQTTMQEREGTLKGPSPKTANTVRHTNPPAEKELFPV